MRPDFKSFGAKLTGTFICQIVISWSGWQCIDTQYSVITLLLLSLWYLCKNTKCFIMLLRCNKKYLKNTVK